MKSNNDLFSKEYYLTDGGLETTLVYHKGIELNHFAAFELLNSEEGRQILKKYYRTYIDIAERKKMVFILETPTWRASTDWGQRMGYSASRLSEINKYSVSFFRDFIREYDYPPENFIISGCIGPRGDGYVPDALMSAAEAKVYHQTQIQDFAYADADLVTAMTINYANEAVGMVKAAKYFGIPVVISFTLETDGCLPGGESLKQAIETVDQQTAGYASHYMINCAHPSHFKHVLEHADGYWIRRIRGIRANASCKSHQELDNSETLDVGDKHELAEGYLMLRGLLPNLKVIGGCCGTDHTHLEQICQALFGELINSM
jgi:S-methylmethionine-dependent homocysteine/selenocysteine methylase